MLSLQDYDNFRLARISLHFNRLMQLTAVHIHSHRARYRAVYIVIKIEEKKKISMNGRTYRFLFAHILRQLNLLLICKQFHSVFFSPFSFFFFSHLPEVILLIILYEYILCFVLFCLIVFIFFIRTQISSLRWDFILHSAHWCILAYRNKYLYLGVHVNFAV